MEYQDLFTNSPAPMWVFRPADLQFIDVNHAAAKHYGYTIDEFLLKTLFDITPVEEHSLLRENLLTVNKETKVIKEAWRHIRKDGSIIHVEISAHSINHKDTMQARLVIINDITARVLAEQALRQSEANYRTLTESTNDLIMRFDRQYRHLYANQATQSYFGQPPEAFIGKTHEELGFAREEFEYWDGRIYQVFTTGQPHHEVTHVQAGDKYVDWSLVPELHQDGHVLSVLSYTRDITPLMKAQQELKTYAEQLRLLNAEKDKFFSIVAHDLRSPFTGFLLQTEMLMSSDMNNISPERIVRFANRMHTAATQLYSLLENLLAWANVQRGITPFQPARVDLALLVSSVLNIMKESLSAKELTIENQLHTPLPVTGDRNMLESVLRNLISNACKFTPHNGKILISGYASINGSAQLSISDSGIGMPDDMIGKLFTISEKTNRKGTDDEESSGLGLLLVKEYLDRHGAAISVKSAPDAGSTFTITFPAQRATF